MEIVELPTATSDPDLITLFTADIPVLVLNPIVASPTAVLQSPLYGALFDNPHAILVIIGIETPETRSYLQSLFVSPLTSSEPGSGKVGEGGETVWTKRPKVIYVNPPQALGSLYALKQNPGSLQAIGVYQHGRLSSRISDFDSAVHENLTEVKAILGNDASPRAFTSIALLRQSLSLARKSLDDSLLEVDRLTSGIGDLLGETEKVKVSLHPDILGVWDGIPGRETGADEVKKAMAKSKEDVKHVIDRLRWWELILRVDDIQEIVNAAIRQQWCKDLERTVWPPLLSRGFMDGVLTPCTILQLAFHTGRLQAIQTQLSDRTGQFLRSFHPPSPFSSPVIYNNYQQLISSPTYLLPPTALLRPLSDRRDTLTKFPVVRLHLAAQQVVLSTLGSVTTGLGVLWANWVGLIENVSLIGMNLGGETIVGAGVLAGVVGLRWSVGTWEKAKRKFWADWERVGNGLARDLTVRFLSTV